MRLLALGGSRMRADARAPSLLNRDHMAASEQNRRPAKSAATTERALLWAFIAGLAWCPFWFGGSVLLAWGINAILFPGVLLIYELSLLIRGEPHPVAMRQIKLPAVLLAAFVLWLLFQHVS